MSLTGLMGSAEMESAVGKMLQLSTERGKPFVILRVRREDFDPCVYERDGFDQLLANGWLDRDGTAYLPTAELVQRVKGRSFTPVRCRCNARTPTECERDCLMVGFA